MVGILCRAGTSLLAAKIGFVSGDLRLSWDEAGL
jgi:hypothetical protein